MTTKQKSAGYFDSLRQSPMYEGDVYYRKGYVEPFYKIMKSEDKGFVVNHVNTREYTPLSDMGSTLIKDGQFIGNILDDPDIIEKFKENPDSCVAGFSLLENNKDSALPEQEQTPDNKQKEDENEQVSADDSTNTTDEQNADAVPEDGNGTDDAANETEDKKEEAADKGSNIIVEKAPEAVPEVIANTREEKNAIERRNFCKKQIEKNNEDIAKLQEKADFHNELASTLKYPPFTKLEKLTIDELHKDVDSREIKDIKEGVKVYENIIAIQNVLKEHSLQAANAENHIMDLEDENEELQNELEELEEKISHFAHQQKINFDACEEAPALAEEKTKEKASSKKKQKVKEEAPDEEETTPADETKPAEETSSEENPAACDIVEEYFDGPESPEAQEEEAQ